MWINLVNCLLAISTSVMDLASWRGVSCLHLTCACIVPITKQYIGGHQISRARWWQIWVRWAALWGLKCSCCVHCNTPNLSLLDFVSVLPCYTAQFNILEENDLKVPQYVPGEDVRINYQVPEVLKLGDDGLWEGMGLYNGINSACCEFSGS